MDYRRLGTVLTSAEVREARLCVSRLQALEDVVFRFKDGTVRKLTQFCEHSPFLKEIRDRFVPVATEATGQPMEPFIENAILKNPGALENPPHQDLALVDLPPDSDLIGIWIALDASTKENGCMRVYPDTGDGYFKHLKDGAWYIPDMSGYASVDLEMSPGEAAMWSGRTVHGSPENTSTKPRWALQFHYKPVGLMPEYKTARIAAFSGR